MSKFKMKVVVNKSKSKVLFAEINNHVVDILLRFLTLPLGKIVRILEHHYGNEAPALGSITNLYKDLFNRANFSTGHSNRLMFMGSAQLETECRKIIRDITSSDDYSAQYLCRSSNCPFFGIQNRNIYSELGICVCCEEPLLDANGGNYTVFSSLSTLSFIINDGLSVSHFNESGFLETLLRLGSRDTEGAETISFKFGVNEVVDLLKFSLISSTPLTDLVFRITSVAVKHKSVIWFDRLNKPDRYPEIKKMILTVFLQKSTNLFLFVVASDEFVEFLFSLLNFALGKCHYYYNSGENGNTGVLYSSLVGCKFMMNRYIRKWLVEPDIDRGYMSNYKDKVEGKYVVDEQNLFIVSNDLRVKPFSVEYIISTGIPLSDVIEKRVLFGRDEAMLLTDNSLKSETALTDALI